jgi:hypothetical protein
VDPVLSSLVYQLPEGVTLAYDLRLGRTITHWKGIVKEIHLGGSIMPSTIIEKFDPKKPSFRPEFSENYFEPARKGGWSSLSTEFLNIMRAREPTCISQMGIKKLFYIFKHIIPLLLNSLHSGLVKLGPKMTRSLEKGAQELHVFARNQYHV